MRGNNSQRKAASPAVNGRISESGHELCGQTRRCRGGKQRGGPVAGSLIGCTATLFRFCDASAALLVPGLAMPRDRWLVLDV